MLQDIMVSKSTFSFTLVAVIMMNKPIEIFHSCIVFQNRTTPLNHFIHVPYDTFKIVCKPGQQTFTEVTNILYRQS